MSASDHTPGALQIKMFVGNGAQTASSVWLSSAIAVTPSTDFFFRGVGVESLLHWMLAGLGLLGFAVRRRSRLAR